MSLQPHQLYTVPDETARVARAAFPRGNTYVRMYDALGTIFQDHAFAPLFSPTGQPAASPVRVALATILQFAEGLSDRQAAAAVRGRIDWKYLLCLELTAPGFDHTVLSEFRTRLLEHDAEQLLFDTLLMTVRDHGWRKAGGKQRTDSTHVLGAIRTLNRLECVGETLRHALNTLAVVAPDWLRVHSPSAWVDRYGPRVEEYRLPTSHAKRHAYAELVGADGAQLLSAIYSATAPAWVREVPAVHTLRQVWLQNYVWRNARLRWREDDNLPPSDVSIKSPYDAAAQFARKRSTTWVGYKGQLTEACDDDGPPLITHVETTTAPTQDGAVTGCIHAALREHDLLPTVHLVDTGFLDAELLVNSHQEYGVDLFGPTRGDDHRQAQAGAGFDAPQFMIDWTAQQAIWPAGCRSSSWTPAVDKRINDVIKIKFAKRDCGVCRYQPQCTDSHPPRRTLTIRPHDQYLALQAARQRETTATFHTQYGERAGIEGTLSQGIRGLGLRRSRYIGLARTHLQHILTATAMNVVRMSAWLAGTPRAPTRRSAFVRLHASTA